MRLFSLTKEIAIDLGTANTVIIHNDKIVIDEPSIVALDRRTDKLIAVGKEAQLMEGREHPGIRTVRPLRKGVIADFNAAVFQIADDGRQGNAPFGIGQAGGTAAADGGNQAVGRTQIDACRQTVSVRGGGHTRF